jgi:hypothetical protein
MPGERVDSINLTKMGKLRADELKVRLPDVL